MNLIVYIVISLAKNWFNYEFAIINSKFIK